jgi:hypothetical protein|tara:strand:- start:172 stop:753 length:582 start_codon:yes stop_codon:yes gene_type:complete
MPIAINGSGTVTGISVGGLPDGCVDTDTLATSVTRGKILQLLSVTKTDTQSIAQSAGTTDISGLSITITPASSSSKFYITGKVQVSQQYASNGHIQIDVNGTDVGKADAASNRPISHTGIGYPATTGYSQYSTFPVAIDFLVNATDGNAHTIKLQGVEVSSGVTLYINRSQTDPDSTAGARYVSTLTVMEVAA